MIAIAAMIAAILAAPAAMAQDSLDDVIRRLLAEDPPARPALPTTPREMAELNALDTHSGHMTRFEVGLDEEGTIGRMRVRVLACHEVDGGVDSFAFVEIVDGHRPETLAFRGWLVASSPALSALDHPRYDIWLHACSTASGEAS